MKFKLIFFTSLILLISTKGTTQNLQPPFLISNGGYIPNNNGISVHWALGEIAVTELKGSQHLTQGFYQAYNYKTETFDFDNMHSISFYPNPVIDELKVIHDYDSDISLEIYDMIGRIISNFQYISSDTKIDLSTYQKGTYLLRFINDNQQTHIRKLIKI